MSKPCLCQEPYKPSDDPKIIFTVYVIAFIPLAFIHALDFITDKWKPIRATRRNGLIQFCISLPCLAYMAFYIYLQMKDKDYKEAAAAMTVAVLNIYHVLRTVWGLIQLHEFKNWNIHALESLLDLGYSAPTYGFSKKRENHDEGRNQWSRRRRLFEDLKSKCTCFWNRIWGNEDRMHDSKYFMTSEEIQRTVDHHMVVNSTLLDNEFTNSALPVTPALLPDNPRKGGRFLANFLKSKKPQECSVRWLVSFLAKFGHQWVSDTSNLSAYVPSPNDSFRQIKRNASLNLAILSCLQTAHVKNKQFVTPCSPLHDFCVHPVNCRTLEITVEEQLELPFRMKGSDGTFDLSKYDATIRDAAVDDWDKSSLNELNSTRDAVRNISPVQLACFSKQMISHFKLKQSKNGIHKTFFFGDTKTSSGKERIHEWKHGCINLDMITKKDYDKFFCGLPIKKEFAQCFLWSRKEEKSERAKIEKSLPPADEDKENRLVSKQVLILITCWLMNLGFDLRIF